MYLNVWLHCVGSGWGREWGRWRRSTFQSTTTSMWSSCLSSGALNLHWMEVRLCLFLCVFFHLSVWLVLQVWAVLSVFFVNSVHSTVHLHFYIVILVLCFCRYGRLNNTRQSKRTERSTQQQCHGHHVLQQPPLPGRGERRTLIETRNSKFSALFLPKNPPLSVSPDYQGPNPGAKQTVLTVLLPEPRVWGEGRQSVHCVPLPRLRHHLWHHYRMGSCALLSAGASCCGGGAGPTLDVLWGEAPFRAAAAHEDKVELANVDRQ